MFKGLRNSAYPRMLTSVQLTCNEMQLGLTKTNLHNNHSRSTNYRRDINMIRKSVLLSVMGAAVMAWSMPAHSSTIKVSTCQMRTHDHVVVFLNEFLKKGNKNSKTLVNMYIH